MTPQEAAEKAFKKEWDYKSIEDYPLTIRTMINAIKIYEEAREADLALEAMKETGGIPLEELEEKYGLSGRVILTTEQAKAFDEPIQYLVVNWGWSRVIFDTNMWQPSQLRQLAAVAEALANNIERFPS